MGLDFAKIFGQAIAKVTVVTKCAKFITGSSSWQIKFYIAEKKIP